jgi:hypothetical protein
MNTVLLEVKTQCGSTFCIVQYGLSVHSSNERSLRYLVRLFPTPFPFDSHPTAHMLSHPVSHQGGVGLIPDQPCGICGAESGTETLFFKYSKMLIICHLIIHQCLLNVRVTGHCVWKE